MTTVHLTLSEALLGFSRVLITHLDGRGVKVTSPKGKIIKAGDSIILRGDGMPIPKGSHSYSASSTKGDLYVLFEIEMPTESWIESVDRKVCFYAGPSCLLSEALFPGSRTVTSAQEV